MALLGGLLLAGAVVLCSVIAPVPAPRLAAVGGLLAITVAVLAAALTGLRDAVSSDDLDWTVPGAGLAVTGLGYAALTVLAWRSTAGGRDGLRHARAPKLTAVVDERIRVVIGKPGLDGHDRGAKVVARALRDAGMEVVYTGLHQTPEQIVETVVQEDADAVGLSVLSGAHMTLFSRLSELLSERGIDDVVVFGGGIIPDEDIPELERLGVAKIFTPGATTTDIVDWVREHVGRPPAPDARARPSVDDRQGELLGAERPWTGSTAAAGSSRGRPCPTREDEGEPVADLEAVHDRRAARWSPGRRSAIRTGEISRCGSSTVVPSVRCRRAGERHELAVRTEALRASGGRVQRHRQPR